MDSIRSKETSAFLEELGALHRQLAALPQDYDFDSPALLSHVLHFAAQPQRLRDYARTAIPARIAILHHSWTMTTQSLIDAFLTGMEHRNPHSILLAARAQLELYALVTTVIRVIKSNAGLHEDKFIDRVLAVDEALINATFGTRYPGAKEQASQLGMSRLRKPNEADMKLFDAINIITRIKKAAVGSDYPTLFQDYELLCEFVHPNWGTNTLLVVPSPFGEPFRRFSLTSPAPFEGALGLAVGPMYRGAQGIWSTTRKVEPPFGWSDLVQLVKHRTIDLPNRATRRAARRKLK